MTWYTDDRRLYWEQRRLDAEQEAASITTNDTRCRWPDSYATRHEILNSVVAPKPPSRTHRSLRARWRTGGGGVVRS